MSGALSELKVLDLTRVLAGPWSTQILADLGAEVIKVERPVVGDDTRHWGPPWMPDKSGQPTEESAYFLSANRGKKSVCIDISTTQGQDKIRALVKDADILVENFKVGGTAKYGLDYASLQALNPRLIYCSITGFGQTGPYSDRLGYDFMIQAMGGLMSITGDGSPQKVGVALSDIMTGLYATIGILAAVTERARSGLGQHVDLALLDVTAATLANQATNYLVGGVVPQAIGNAHPNIVPYQSFEVADGHLVVATGNDGQFLRFAQLLDIEVEQRYRSNAGRVAHRQELVALIAEKMKARPRDEWLQLLEAAQVPASPINTVEDVYNNEQVLARDMRVQLQHSSGGQIEVPGNPIKLSRTPVAYHLAPPLLGEHDDDYL